MSSLSSRSIPVLSYLACPRFRHINFLGVNHDEFLGSWREHLYDVYRNRAERLEIARKTYPDSGYRILAEPG